MATPTLSTISGNLGVIFTEDDNINVKMTEFTLPLTNTSGNVAINWKGKTRVILVQGAQSAITYAGATPDAKLRAFKEDVENWVQGQGQAGNIQATAVYTNSYGQTYNVKCFDWSCRRSFQDPYRIIYTLLLKQV